MPNWISLLNHVTEKIVNNLTEKIGSLLKTHLDFINWYQHVKNEYHKHDLNFSKLLKLLHRLLPLNLISQYLDLSKIDYNEMTKMLRNTLVDKG
ncbi:unnamed protein product [Brachionus calyciflorus]|uniref:Uncharacterized protein n=1 Tax=Brachionus calyciflorus TaxID=104777 RepID=A0A814KTU1_9BILA|nr:unnamed protein product [Brachionus calyciflorus]